jgi:hypothetical protein
VDAGEYGGAARPVAGNLDQPAFVHDVEWHQVNDPETVGVVGRRLCQEGLMRLAICAIAKNEGRYIAEWITHHLRLGFDRIVLYDNGSTDDTAAVAGQWPGQVVVIPWLDRPGQMAQHAAYAHFLREHAPTADWLMWLDCDEFVNPKRHDTMPAFLADTPYAAIGVNWRMFGSAGLAADDGRSVRERFTMASLPDFGPNHIIKTVVRAEAVLAPGIHSPSLRPGYVLVSPSGRPLKPSPAVRQEAVEHDLISVNHYFTKSRSEWTVKRDRGTADTLPERGRRIRNDAEFAFNNRNDVEERSILRFLPHGDA